MPMRNPATACESREDLCRSEWAKGGEIYSLRARRWASAEVLNIESRVARLKYLQYSEVCYFRTEDMLIFKERFRLVGPER